LDAVVREMEVLAQPLARLAADHKLVLSRNDYGLPRFDLRDPSYPMRTIGVYAEDGWEQLAAEGRVTYGVGCALFVRPSGGGQRFYRRARIERGLSIDELVVALGVAVNGCLRVMASWPPPSPTAEDPEDREHGWARTPV